MGTKIYNERLEEGDVRKKKKKKKKIEKGWWWGENSLAKALMTEEEDAHKLLKTRRWRSLVMV